MRRLRSIWVLRLAATLLLVSLAPSVFGPAAFAAQAESAEGYAAWLQSQLAQPNDPTVERALAAALEKPAASFDRFVRSFVEAYEAEQPEADLTALFSVEALSTDALVRALYGRYAQVLGAAPGTQATLSGTSGTLSGLSPRFVAVLPAVPRLAAADEPVRLAYVPGGGPAAAPVRIYSAAYPQGP